MGELFFLKRSSPMERSHLVWTIESTMEQNYVQKYPHNHLQKYLEDRGFCFTSSSFDSDDESDLSDWGYLSYDQFGFCISEMSIADQSELIIEDRQSIILEEITARMALIENWENMQREELLRLERIGKDEILRARTFHRKSFVSKPIKHTEGDHKSRRITVPRVKDQAATFSYTGGMPRRSSLVSLRDESRMKRKRASFCDLATVHSMDTHDGELALKEWIKIAHYSTVKHMVMLGLKKRFGSDAADPSGWVSATENYSWLDDIYREVKDWYQTLHDEEHAEFTMIQMEASKILVKQCSQDAYDAHDWWWG